MRGHVGRGDGAEVALERDRRRNGAARWGLVQHTRGGVHLITHSPRCVPEALAKDAGRRTHTSTRRASNDVPFFAACKASEVT